jgi:hypothetical protein
MSGQDFNPNSTDAKFATILAMLEDIKGTLPDHEERITKLEHKVWLASGVATVLGFLAGKLL